jgi:hypothetical protein
MWIESYFSTMKRCPVDQGGCGELVDVLFKSGLCQKCDAAVNRGTAAVGGSPRRQSEPEPGADDQPETKPCEKYVKGPERGICATCTATRAAHSSKPRERRQQASSNGALAPAFMSIEQLRSQYTEEYDAGMAAAKTAEAKLEILDDVEKAMRKAAK